MQVTSRVLDDLSVIIPTLGRPVLERTLGSIVASRRWPARLIVVHQGSDPAVLSWLRRAEQAGIAVEYIRSTQRGVAAARNRGIESVATRRFAINDDDQIVDAAWLERMQAWIEHLPLAVITGRVQPEASGVPSSISADAPAVHVRPLWRRDPLFAGNMGTSIDVVRRVGLFDERPPLDGAEDNDWGYRALRAGVPIVYAPDVTVTHLNWRTDQQIDATYRRYALAQGGFYGKHLRRGDPFIAGRMFRDACRGPWLLLRGAVTRNRDLLALGRAEVAGILPGALRGVRMKHLAWDRVPVPR